MRIALYDATLTEGAREPGVQLSVRDRLRVALRLADMGVAWIEAGWPASDPDVFREARRVDLAGTRLCACAAVGRDGAGAELRAAIGSGAPAVTVSVDVRRGGAAAARRVAAAVKAVRRADREPLVELVGFFDRGAGGRGLAAAVAGARAGAEAVFLSDAA
ncbi:MAG TPA: hypothetical protein VFP65_13045, partial [Anaeromyxobacteraceae bacterium]|nr:hypothetical protein [Anaeromyxobacteraceae bacterium]